MNRKFLAAAIAAGMISGAAVLDSPAHAELKKPDGFPERPITMIVPYGAGGGSDQLSRAMGAAIEKVMGVGIQIVNKPGSGGLTAIPEFMTGRADGYTILQHIDDAVTNYASGKLKENPAEDWTPICMAQITFNQIYIRSDEKRFTDWDSFVKYAKANPGQLKVSNVGNLGSMERVNMLLLEKAVGIKTNQIAFDKPSERYASLIGGHVDAMFEQPGDVRQFLDSDKMKPILTLLHERPSAFKDTPSMKDIGVDFEPLLRFRGFYVRKETPQERLGYLEAACKQAWNSESFQKFNKQKYMHLIDSFRDSAGAKKLIADSVKIYKAVYEEIGLLK